MDSQIQQLIDDDDELVVDVEEAADVFMAAGRAVKWCQGKIKELQPPSLSGVAAPSSGSLTTKLPDLTRPSFSGEYTQYVSFWDHWLTTLVDSKVDMANVEKLPYLKLSLKGVAAQIVLITVGHCCKTRYCKAKVEGALQQQAFNRESAPSSNSSPTGHQEGVKCRAAQVVGIDE